MSVKVTSEKKELGSILKCHCRNKSPTCADCSGMRKRRTYRPNNLNDKTCAHARTHFSLIHVGYTDDFSPFERVRTLLKLYATQLDYSAYYLSICL